MQVYELTFTRPGAQAVKHVRAANIQQCVAVAILDSLITAEGYELTGVEFVCDLDMELPTPAKR